MSQAIKLNTGSSGSGITTLAADTGSATGSTVNIVGGTGITTSASGSTLTIATTGSSTFTWNTITSNQTLAVNNGYITNNSSGAITLTLPATASVGDSIKIVNISLLNAGWTIVQNAGQQIRFGGSGDFTTVGVAGGCSSSSSFPTFEIVCVVGGSSTIWSAMSIVGNITFF